MVIKIGSKNSLIEWTEEDVDKQATACCGSHGLHQIITSVQRLSLLHLRNEVARGFYLLAPHEPSPPTRRAWWWASHLNCQDKEPTQPEIYSCSLVVNKPETHLCVLPCEVREVNLSHALGTDPPQPCLIPQSLSTRGSPFPEAWFPKDVYRTAQESSITPAPSARCPASISFPRVPPLLAGPSSSVDL
jgi:hypothetical protein